MGERNGNGDWYGIVFIGLVRFFIDSWWFRILPLFRAFQHFENVLKVIKNG